LNWTELILPVVLAIIAASPGVVALFKGRRKEKADVAEAITRAAGELVEDYQQRLERLERIVEEQAITIDGQAKQIKRQSQTIGEQADRINTLELERDKILTGVLALCQQIHELGQDPVWRPDAPNNNQ